MHSDGKNLISGTWNILAAAVGNMFFTHVVVWNVVPFAAHADADSGDDKLTEGIDKAELKELAELQKLWVKVRQCGSGRECGSVHWQAMWQWELAVWSWQCGVWSVHWYAVVECGAGIHTASGG